MDDDDPTPDDGSGPVLSALIRELLEHVAQLITALVEDDVVDHHSRSVANPARVVEYCPCRVQREDKPP